MSLVEQIDKTTVPRHVAIIMDGNGRWAKQRNLDRSQGHRKGLDVVHEITNAAADIGVECLTLYAFSTENWNRPQEEVDALMSLVVFGIERETPGMIANGVRLGVIGDIGRMPTEVQKTAAKVYRRYGCRHSHNLKSGAQLFISLGNQYCRPTYCPRYSTRYYRPKPY